MALTDSLDAATQQVLALLAQLKLSNCRIIQAQDTGAADAVTLTPSPVVSAYGPDLLILADIAHPNATTTPNLKVSDLPPLLIQSADGSAARPGSVAGKCLFGFSSAVGGGYTARLLFSVPVTSYADNSFWHIGTAAGGSANALTTTLSPVPAIVGNGLNFRVPAPTANTAASTISFLDSAGTSHTYPIVSNKTGAALVGGELPGTAGFVGDFMLEVVAGVTSARLMNAAGTTDLPLAQALFTAACTTTTSVSNSVPSAATFNAGSCAFGAISGDGLSFVVSRTGRYGVTAEMTVAVGSNVGNVNSQCTIEQNGASRGRNFDNSYEGGSGTIAPTVDSTAFLVATAGDVINIMGTAYSYGTFYGGAITGGSMTIVALS